MARREAREHKKKQIQETFDKMGFVVQGPKLFKRDKTRKK